MQDNGTATQTTAFWTVALDGQTYSTFWTSRDGGKWVNVSHVHEYDLAGVKMSTEVRVTYKDFPGDNSAEGALKAVQDALALAKADQDYKETAVRA